MEPHIPSEYCALDTFTFVREINELPLSGKFMVSFDVESLFTNIPLEECVNLAVDYISKGNPDLQLTKTELRNLFNFATAQTHFLFKGSFFDQIDGVAMGSPLAPVLANLFMGHHERIWLENYKASSILLYQRYVDDTFCLFDTEHDATLFFDYINDRHPNIRFTMEKEMDKKIPFLDVLIDNSQPLSPITRIYRKKTFTGLLTNYFSFTPFSYKLGLIRTLVDRTYKINNTWVGFHEDIKKLLLILRKNLFPSHIVERVIKQYIIKTQTLSNTPASPPSNPTHFFKLPYVGPFSIVAQNRLRKLLKRYCNNLDVKLPFSSFKIRNMFSVKDPVPVELCSNVVYKFTCASCNSCYVGETNRHLSTRIREHLNRDRTSHIFKRLQQSEACRTSCSAECFEVIDRATTKFQVKIKEALHISWEQPSLNKQLYHVNLTL